MTGDKPTVGLGNLPEQSPLAAILWWHMAENGVLLLPMSEWGAETLDDYLYLCQRNYPVRMKYAMDMRDSLKRWSVEDEG